MFKVYFRIINVPFDSTRLAYQFNFEQYFSIGNGVTDFTKV